MNIKSIITAALALLISTACSGGAKQEKVMAKDGKALVVFFSHAGDNYAVGNIEVGNTKIVADYITEVTGAEQFEIVTHKYDGMAYTPLINLAKEDSLRLSPTSMMAWLIHHSSIWRRKRPKKVNCQSMRATLTCQNMTPYSSVVPYGGEPIRR